MEKFYIKRFESFRRCLADFAHAKEKDYKGDSFILSGIVAKFSLTFDLSWKLMKDIIVQYYNITDYAIGSPSENLKKAFAVGLIADDATWKQMLKLRNDLTHDYNYELALASCDTIVGRYIDFFKRFESNTAALLARIEREA